MDERTTALLQELTELRDKPGTPFEMFCILNHAVSKIRSLSNDLERARQRAEQYAEELDAQENQATAVSFYVRNKSSGRCHMVGADQHDSIWVDAGGTLFYQNLQSGEGCGPFSHHNSQDSYEFVQSDCGEIQEEDSHGSSDDL